MSFESLGLSTPILKAIKDQGYETPSPIQAQAIPAVLKGQDVMAAAQTGTGKTAGFTLPLLERLSNGRQLRPNHVRALVLTPTRELAAQVSDSVSAYSQYLPIRSAVVFGGVKINPQMMKLRKGLDILVATPGRLLDLHTKNAVNLGEVEVLILDEADRMLDMGFITDIRKIIELLPKRRQNLMFSATFSKDIRQLAKGLVNDPVEISVTPENSTAKTVEQWVIPVDKAKKSPMLISLIKDRAWFQVLVFCRTKHGANKLSHQLNKAGIKAAPIHGNKSQGARTRALAEFKKGDLHVLVATDIAARGLDIDQLPQVVNFDLPHVSEDYVHRIGRTGRAGAEGQAVSLVCAEEYKELVGIERLIQEHIPRQELNGFVPTNPLAESPAHLKPLKAKKPKKNKKMKFPEEAPLSKTSEHSASDESQRSAKVGQRKRKPGAKKQDLHNTSPAKKSTRESKGKPKQNVNENIWGGSNKAAKPHKNTRQNDSAKDSNPALATPTRQPRKRPVSKA